MDATAKKEKEHAKDHAKDKEHAHAPAGGGHSSGRAKRDKDAVPTANVVTVSKGGFLPARLEIEAGDSVTWTNTDAAGKHSVRFAAGTGPDGATLPPASGAMLPGKSFEHTFGTAGTYEYADEHSTARGVVIVS